MTLARLQKAKAELRRRRARAEMERRQKDATLPGGDFPSIDRAPFDTVESQPPAPGPYDIPAKKRDSWGWLETW